MQRRLVIAGGAGPAAAPVPPHLIDRYALDTRWYGRYLDAWGLPILGPHQVPDATLVRLRDRLGALLPAHPHWPVPELDRRDVRLVVVARGQRTSVVPEVRRRSGSELDVRSPGGATDTFPLVVVTDGDPVATFVRSIGGTLHRMALRHIDPALTTELDVAYQAARRLGLWLNTSAAAGADVYFAAGIQIYFGVNRPGPVGGDGVHNHISSRAALQTYDRPLYALLERLYRGRALSG